MEQLGFFEGYDAGKTGGSVSRIKKYFIEKNGRCCSICNNDTWNNNPIPLILDHIDGKSNNFKINNLRIICPNCDALLPTYGGRNKGNGNRIHKVTIKRGV